MPENRSTKFGKAPAPTAAATADKNPPITYDGADFPADFAKLKLAVIKPAFESIGSSLEKRGHHISISEDDQGKISIHIVPAGANRSIHPWDWFPTLSFFGVPYTKTVAVQGRNARRNSEGTPGSRGNYKPAQISRELVEKELMKFVGEIANW